MQISLYKTVDSDGDFVAFWQQDQDVISFYSPSIQSEIFEHSLKGWKSLKLHTHPIFGDKKYTDTINAATYYLQLHDQNIDRSRVRESLIEPGAYFPNIWRGYPIAEDGLSISYNPIDPQKIYGYKYTQAVVAASSLFEALAQMFTYVEPAAENHSTFSHRIRELLILACTEIESGWRAVLDGNTKPENRKDRYTTTDYFRVKEPLGLGGWCVTLHDYPDLSEFSPFRQWTSDRATQSIPWYNSYNAVKHNRELHFKDATLGSLLDSMAALHIMQVAQWGPNSFDRAHDNRFSPFRITRVPIFNLGEMYMPTPNSNNEFFTCFYFDEGR